jgi:hypothetical protein
VAGRESFNKEITMNSLGLEHEMSDAEKEKLALLLGDDPPTLSHGGGGSGKTLSSPDDFDALAKRLTGDAPVKGIGRALKGAEAAAYGRAMLENSAGGPEKLAELIENLKKYREG